MIRAVHSESPFAFLSVFGFEVKARGAEPLQLKRSGPSRVVFLNKLARRESAESSVRPVKIEVDAPRLDNLAGLRQAVEEMLVEALVTQPPVKTLDEGVLGGFAWRDAVPLDATVLGPFEDGMAGHFGSVVGDDGPWTAAGGDKPVQFTSQPQARD